VQEVVVAAGETPEVFSNSAATEATAATAAAGRKSLERMATPYHR
jgi:hypothetical protein